MGWIEFELRKIDKDMVELVFTIKRSIKPEELKYVIPPPIPGGMVLLISGRGPIWLYGHLIHHYARLTKAVAIFDPKIPGYVVAASRTQELKPGDVITREIHMEAL